MKKRLILHLILCLCVQFILFSQDKVRIMQYNLLYYGVSTGFCNNTNNGLSRKDSCLREIFWYVRPDIFTVNEISKKPEMHQRIVDSVLNIKGETKYKHANIINVANSSIVNGLFYHSGKFTLKNHTAITGELRDYDHFELYYNSPDLAKGDTAFLNLIVVHLKAGNNNDDIKQRSEEVQVILDYMSKHKSKTNFFFMGDLNVYTFTEPAFQKLMNNSYEKHRFFDPINKLGTWSDNPDFAEYFTQATLVKGDCGSGGGMDDRFDFILVSKSVMDGSDKIKYVQNSYKTLGQDGKRFNQSIDDPPNYSAPQSVIRALARMSDHLPVYLDVEILQTPNDVNFINYQPFKVYYVDNSLFIKFDEAVNEEFIIQVHNIMGEKIYETKSSLSNELNLSINLKSGIYFVSIFNKNNFYVAKFGVNE